MNDRLGILQSERALKKLPVRWLSTFLIIVVCMIGIRQAGVNPASIQMPVACPSTDQLNRFGVNEPLGWPGLYPPSAWNARWV